MTLAANSWPSPNSPEFDCSIIGTFIDIHLGLGDPKMKREILLWDMEERTMGLYSMQGRK